jgi:hypothetical protein
MLGTFNAEYLLWDSNVCFIINIESHYAEWLMLIVIMPWVIILSVIMLSAIILSVVMLTALALPFKLTLCN